MKQFKTLFKGLSIHYRLLFSYSALFLLTLTFGIILIYSMVRTTLEDNIENELKNSTQTILGMVKTAVDASIRNHLRAIAESNHNMVLSLYTQSQKGIISPEEAKLRAIQILLSQPIGKSGYIYCINQKGMIQVHPQTTLVGTDLSGYGFIQTQKKKKEGYIEYDWANPGEKTKRPKALYMTYFAPWDWIISVSSYREEFNELISVEDFKKSILSLRFGKTGYPYIMDSKGLLIIHPKLQGTNIYDSRDDNGRMFIKEICKKKNGKIIYPWKNPGEKKARKKLVIFNYIPEMDWIIASSSYLEEFYHPLTTIGYSMAVTILFMLTLIIPLTWLLSSRLATPLQKMINVFESGAKADFSNRLDIRWGGEMDRVAENYNKFIDKLQKTSRQLQTSEEQFRSIFENSVEGIFQVSYQGNFLAVNPAMATMLGYDSPVKFMKTIRGSEQQLFKDPARIQEILGLLKGQDILRGIQVQLIRKDRKSIWISFNAKAYRDKAGDVRYLEGFLSDITEQRRSERALKQSHEELENRVDERTRELSDRVMELELRNDQSALLQKMSEMIQVCHTADEIFQVLHQYFTAFFPKSSGQFFIYSPEGECLDPLVNWGNLSKETAPVLTEDCWALRRDKPYLMDKARSSLPCAHMDDSEVSLSLCVPMISHGEILGMLHIRFPRSIAPPGEGFHRIALQRIALKITQHIALALVNINLRQSLKQQSIQDPLTGLYNRRFLDKNMKREAARMVRYHYNVGIIMIDVDRFKLFNDTHGHECGDAVLKALGGFLSSHVRAGDMACRYGGEEFVLMLINTSLENAVQKAESLCQKVRDMLKILYNESIFTITISLGVAVCPLHGKDLETTLTMADQALYRAKEAGRDQVVWIPVL